MKHLTRSNRFNVYQFMSLPAFLLFAFLFIYPLTRGIGMSLTDWNGITAAHFVGLANFSAFFQDPRAIGDIQTTILFAIGSAILLNLVGLAYALLMKGSSKIISLARVIIYLPAIISPLIMGYIWYFLLQPERGFLYRLVEKVSATASLGNWLEKYSSALLVLVLVNVWQYAGMTMIIYLSGLQSIDEELYEAAAIDGANGRQRFTGITLPMLMPSVRINVVTNIIGSLAVFDVIMALTDGGPGYATESLSIYIMRMCYGSRTGYSTAVAIILFALILAPVSVSLRLMKEKK